jgi:hypothetical protein
MNDEVVVVLVVGYVRYSRWNGMKWEREWKDGFEWIWCELSWVELSGVVQLQRERERERGEERVACGRLENIIAAYGIDV